MSVLYRPASRTYKNLSLLLRRRRRLPKFQIIFKSDYFLKYAQIFEKCIVFAIIFKFGILYLSCYFKLLY